MSPDSIPHLLAEFNFGPRVLDVRVPLHSYLSCLSAETQKFIEAIRCRFKLDSVVEINGVRWTSDAQLRETYGCLAEESRKQVCWFMTVLVHELVHYCDFLTTPFGVDFYARTLREYLAFQTLAPYLLSHTEILPEGRLVDFELESVPELPVEVRKAWRTLRDQMYYFEAIGDGGAMRPRSDRVVKGWGEKRQPFTILGREVRPVTVREFFITIEIPDAPGWYLRPLTILEARAVAQSLMWLSYLFHDIKHGEFDILRYFREFYMRHGQLADYTFVLNLGAHISGRNTFESFIKDMSLDMIHRMCEIIAGIGWYALHAPIPNADPNEHLASSPIARLIYIIGWLGEAIQSGEFSQHKDKSLTDFLARMDADESAKVFGARSPDTVLKAARIEALRCSYIAKDEVVDPAMRDHFLSIFRSLYFQFTDREELGYAFPMGVPLTGNPFWEVTSERSEIVHRHLFRQHPPSETVKSWFTFRRNLLFGFMRSDKVVNGLESFFGAQRAPN